jgi:CRISPR-associated protein Cmr2
MPNQMLLFTIGPVQPFIAQARKTRDLWLGSFLLSTLMEAALSDLGGTLVFPATRKIEGNIADLPNKFVALFETDKQATAEAEQAQKRLEKRWKEIADEVWRYIFTKAQADGETRRIWDTQTNPATLFEFYWVVAARRPGETYGAWYNRAQQALDTRKRLRNFAQQRETGEKSTISGEREALHNAANNIKALQAFWSYIADQFPEAQLSHGGVERLDAIDTIKRFAARVCGLPEQSFPSTSSVATAPFVEGVLVHAPQLSGALDAWEEVTQPPVRKHPANPEALPYLHQRRGNRTETLRRDGDCLFVETFTPKHLQDDYGLSPEEADRLAKNAPGPVAALRKAASAAGVHAPSPYYGVLVMDGDHMGMVLGSVREQAQHAQISETLSRFSRAIAPAIVEREYPAKLVYAGGDDVMALVPLRDILKVSNRVQRAYRDAMKDVPHPPDQPVTMSAGIALAHHQDPLSYVLREARRAEDQAKERYGRNALVVTLLRRSGETTTVGCKWTYPDLDAEGQPLTLFPHIADLLDQDILSTKFVYNLAEEAATLSRLPPPAQASEINRLLLRGRSAIPEKRDQLPDAEVRLLAERLAALAAVMNMPPQTSAGEAGERDEARKQKEYQEIELWRPGPRRGLVEVSGWLLLLSFSLRGGTD